MKHSILQRWIANRDGASAIEFALVFPVFLLIVLGIIAYGAYLAAVHGVQQLAAEAARSSIGGLSADERATLAETYVSAHAATYPLIAPHRLTVSAGAADPSGQVYRVTVTYDASGMFIYSLPNLIPLPSSTIRRQAAIQRGGY